MSVHETAIIGPDVEMGSNVIVGAYSVIRGKVIIGDNTYISSHVSIGEPPEHSSLKYELNEKVVSNGLISIGSSVVIREFTTVNQPMKNATIISDRCYVMARCHVSHDCYLEEDVTLSTNVCLGGWSRVMVGANIGLGVITHQFTTIGSYSMIAMNATVVKDVPPFKKYIPGKPLGENTYAFEKFKLSPHNTYRESTLEIWNSLRKEGRRSY